MTPRKVCCQEKESPRPSTPASTHILPHAFRQASIHPLFDRHSSRPRQCRARHHRKPSTSDDGKRQKRPYYKAIPTNSRGTAVDLAHPRNADGLPNVPEKARDGHKVDEVVEIIRFIVGRCAGAYHRRQKLRGVTSSKFGQSWWRSTI